MAGSLLPPSLLLGREICSTHKSARRLQSASTRSNMSTTKPDHLEGAPAMRSESLPLGPHSLGRTGIQKQLQCLRGVQASRSHLDPRQAYRRGSPRPHRRLLFGCSQFAALRPHRPLAPAWVKLQLKLLPKRSSYYSQLIAFLSHSFLSRALPSLARLLWDLDFPMHHCPLLPWH